MAALSSAAHDASDALDAIEYVWIKVSRCP